MKYLIIQLASIGDSIDKKERLLFIPQSTLEPTLAGFKVSRDTVLSNIPAANFMTISFGEYEKNKDNWDEYKAKLIAEKRAQLDPPAPVEEKVEEAK